MQINTINLIQKTNIAYRNTSPKGEVAPIDNNIDILEISNKNDKKRNKIILSALGAGALAAGLYFIFGNNSNDGPNNDDNGSIIEEDNSTKSESSNNKLTSEKSSEIKPKWQEYNEARKELKKCNKDMEGLPDGYEKSQLIDLRKEIVKKIKNLEQRAISENFSLLEKKDLSNATEDERWKYFDDYAFGLMRHNEASAIDCIEMFEKYGMRRRIDPKISVGGSTMEVFLRSMPKDPSDALSNRLVDALNKIITPEKPNIERELHAFMFTLLHADKYLSEDTLLKAINLIKKMEFWTTDYDNLPEKIDTIYCGFKFKNSPRLPEIKTALADLQKLWDKQHNILRRV